MKELSLNILDIAQNSVKARASLIYISLVQDGNLLTIAVSDNGCGMKEEMLKNVTDPFCTSRTTRKVGLGIPFFKLAAEQTGGSFEISSRHEEDFPENHGTVTKASFDMSHIDATPLGDIITSIITLIQGMGNIDLVFTHKSEVLDVSLDTRELKEVLGGDVPLSNPEVLLWIKQFLEENYKI